MNGINVTQVNRFKPELNNKLHFVEGFRYYYVITSEKMSCIGPKSFAIRIVSTAAKRSRKRGIKTEYQVYVVDFRKYNRQGPTKCFLFK